MISKDTNVYIQKASVKSEYVVIPNKTAQDESLSWKARGLLTYLLSLPESWLIRKNELITHARDGRDSTNAAFNELVKAGYINIEQVPATALIPPHKKYFVYPSPESPQRVTRNGLPVYGNPTEGKPATVKGSTIKETYTKETLIKETSTKDTGESAIAKNFDWYKDQFDQMYLETLSMTHKGKNIEQAIRESFAHLAADEVRLKKSEKQDCRKLLNTWLSNKKSENHQPKQNTRSAEVIDENKQLTGKW